MVVEGLDIARLHESEVRDRVTGLGVRFITLPAGSLVAPDVLEDPSDAMGSLGLEQLSEPLNPSLVPYAVASILQREDASAAVEHFGLVLEHREAFHSDHPEVLAFAEYVTYANVVPVEHSPLSLDSLGNLLASRSGAAAGVGVGIMVAGGPTPLLLVTVPLGMIIVGSAKGIADGLEDGFRYRIRRLMGVPSDSLGQ